MSQARAHLSTLIGFCLFIVLTACQSANKTSTVRASASAPVAQGAPAAPPAPHERLDQNQVRNVGEIPADAVYLPGPFFNILYNRDRNIAYYSEYTLTAENLSKRGAKRRENFHPDLRLKALGIEIIPQSGTFDRPYDRGHLSPAGDFIRSQEAMDATFVMSNMAPQRDSMNRRSWQRLETTVREWTCEEKRLQIISGPILENDLPELRSHPLPIPRKYFKAVLDLTPPRKMIGFIMYQTDLKAGDHKKRAVSVHEIERQTGLELFRDDVEARDLKDQADLEAWNGSKDCIAGGGRTSSRDRNRERERSRGEDEEN